MPEPEYETKSYPLADFEWKSADDAPEGSFVATFATLNVIDHHGDVTLPGAFADGKTVAIGGYQHDMSALPVGRATLRSDANRAWVEGAFNLNTTTGRDTYETLKALQDVLEWSYIFTAPEWSMGEFETDKGAVNVRYLKKIDVWSVDPVLKGAGIGTGTDSIKGQPQLPIGDHAEQVLANLQAFQTRVESLADLRAKDGRVLSAANVARVGSVANALKALAADLDDLLTTSAPPKDIDLSRVFVEYQRTAALLEGALS